jgi:hypothetical protein
MRSDIVSERVKATPYAKQSITTKTISKWQDVDLPFVYFIYAFCHYIVWDTSIKCIYRMISK